MQQKEFQFRWRPASREELLGAWMRVRSEAAIAELLRARELGGVQVRPHAHLTRKDGSWCRPPGKVGGWLLTKCHSLYTALLQRRKNPGLGSCRNKGRSVGTVSASHLPVRATPRFAVSRARHLGVLGHGGFHPVITLKWARSFCPVPPHPALPRLCPLLSRLSIWRRNSGCTCASPAEDCPAEVGGPGLRWAALP